MISRSVSIANSATQRLDAANDRLDGLVDMLEVGAEAEDCASQAIAAVNASAAHHHPAFLLDVAHQPLVELVHVPAFRQIAESDHGKLRFGPGVEPVEPGQASVEVAGKRKLLGLG